MEKKLTKEQTKEKALRILEFRQNSEYELRQKLIRAGSEPDDIEEAVEFLLKYGFLNDEKYALSKAKELVRIKKFGKIRVVADLKQRGIAQEYIQAAIEQLEDNEEEALLPMVEKKLKGDFEKKSTDRAIRYFAAKGYKFDDIKRCIEQLKEG